MRCFLTLLALALTVLTADARPIVNQLSGFGVRMSADGCTTSYVTGDRTSSITVTTSTGLQHASSTGTDSDMVNGVTDDSDDYYFDTESVSGHWMKFQFTGGAHIVDEATWRQSGTQTHGDWQWQGSNNDADWTNIGTTFTLGGATVQTQTELNGNTTAYTYYRLNASSGSKSGGPFIREVEFQQCAP